MDIVGTEKGTCAVSPIIGDFTLCGDAFDLCSDEPGYEWSEAKTSSVTCADCCRVIKFCKGLKTRDVKK